MIKRHDDLVDIYKAIGIESVDDLMDENFTWQLSEGKKD
jgi:hypothetical protein